MSLCACMYNLTGLCNLVEAHAHGCVNPIKMELGQLFAHTNLRNSPETSEQTQNGITNNCPGGLVGCFDC